MKSFINLFVLCCLVILVGCSGGSPKQPNNPTVPTDQVWQITGLDASDSNPIVSTPVTLVATVTLNGGAAPDETEVEFVSNGGIFENGTTAASVLTSGGQASVGFVATSPGGYLIQARVKTVTRQVTVTYRNPDNSDALQIWSFNPSAGSYAGGESVILTGKGIRNPVEVFFTVQGLQYQGIVDSVVESAPLSAAGTITVRTPDPTAADTSITSQADVAVKVGVGTSDEQLQSYPSAFTFISDSVTIGEPVVFGVEPYYGRSQGGETVTILGLNFAFDQTKELVKNFRDVYFDFQGQRLLAEVVRWSETQIEVVTPRFSLTPLQNDVNAGVVLTRVDSGSDIVKNDIFIVQADVAQPEITGISPTAGPLDGGTVVTISGHGFELPIQVHFGDLEATNVQVFDDQSPADNDVITCQTPDYSQQGQVPPLFVSVRVTNLQSGNTTTAAQTFRYGDLLYVGQANPTEGQIGDQLTLFGSGFEDPLTVFFLGSGDEFDVLAVTGTELTLRSPTSLAPTCNDRTGGFRVVLNQSNQSAEGGSYTLLGSNPTITSVDPIFVQSAAFGTDVIPREIDINGVRFNDELLVRVNNYVIDPTDVTVVSPELIEVARIPAPTEFGLVFNTSSCTTGSGLPGIRQVATPVDVTVRNLPVGCEDTLRQTLVYLPEDGSCVAAPELVVNINTNFPTTAAGTCSPPELLELRNDGEGTLEVTSVLLVGRFFFDGGASIQNAGPITIPPFSVDTSLSVYFCPDVANGLQYTGTLVVSSNDPNSPLQRDLRGFESTPPEIATAPYADGDTWSFPATTAGSCSATETLIITSSGVSDLTLSSVTSSNPTVFEIVSGPAPGTVLTPTQTANVDVRFCPAAAGAASGTLTIDHDATNEPDPIVISFGGTGL